jgi:biotin synthase
MSSLENILNKQTLNKNDLQRLLSLSGAEDIKKLYQSAYRTKLHYVGNTVYFRGLIELSNLCTKNCYYCGIRKGNTRVERYALEAKEVLALAKWADANGYASIVLQAGERQDKKYTEYISDLIRKIKKETKNQLGITLSLGEQSAATYKKWFNAGAHRYLLRIETSNPQLYKKLHPADHSFSERVNCLKTLKKLGYQVGTGVMIGLPGQTIADLVKDILFFKKLDIDMIGMGPYIPHADTPLFHTPQQLNKKARLELGLKMIAVTRLYLKDINIASTTALQTLHQLGRELGLQAGANIIMPNMTPLEHRKKYLLYAGKPCLDDDQEHCKKCLKQRIAKLGETIGYGQWGDSPHFKKKKI